MDKENITPLKRPNEKVFCYQSLQNQFELKVIQLYTGKEQEKEKQTKKRLYNN